jgi:hypothetical protein
MPGKGQWGTLKDLESANFPLMHDPAALNDK